jgi:hypothetical protein
MEQCLLCLEEIKCTDNLSCPTHCKCKVSLHLDCLKQIELSGLLCPICRIKKSQKVIVIRYNGDSYLLYFANKFFEYFVDRPNIFSFMILILMSFIISFCLLPQLLWLSLNDSKYRSTALAFIGIILFVFFQNKLFYL